MNQQSMRKAARLAASDIANARSRLGVESRSDRRSRSSCCRRYSERPSLSAYPQVPVAIAKLRSLPTIQMYGRSEHCPSAGAERCQKSRADLETWLEVY